MLLASPKGTVPVLCVDGLVIDQSIDIMHWALSRSDPDGWLKSDVKVSRLWVEKNDGPFKTLLDQYKYLSRHPELKEEEVLRAAKEIMLDPMEECLKNTPYLLGKQMTWVDVAIFPFLRQFSMVNAKTFEELPFPAIQKWLALHLQSDLFQSIMEKHPVWVDAR
jgi:glutathione S-transferase